MQRFLIIFAYLFQVSLAFTPSKGCDTTLPDQPFPGHHADFHVDYDDKLNGKVNRFYILGLPKGYDNTEPLPLIFNLHGWTETANGHIHYSPWAKLIKEENFVLVLPQGMDDDPSGSPSWNCSSSVGPKGPTCDLDRDTWGEIGCYNSCPLCDAKTSCDWTSCHDDIGFLDFLIHRVSHQYCIDMDHIHLSGISNGGMFAYYVASQATDALGLATINPVAASSLIGYGDPPATKLPISIIDIHGLNDNTIPYNFDASNGNGPHHSLISYDGFYYDDKKKLMRRWASAMDCDIEEQTYPTEYDGQRDWRCFERLCPSGQAFVRCTGNWNHDYALPPHHYDITAKVAYRFMMHHPRIR